MGVLHSKRGYLYLIERARIYERDGRVEFAQAHGDEAASFNIPSANTSFLLLGPGSSISNEAVRVLAADGVAIGFSGSGGTPLLAGQELVPNLVTPISEYRSAEYLTRWVRIWQSEEKSLELAKFFFARRLDNVETAWGARVGLDDIPFPTVPDRDLATARRGYRKAETIAELMGCEGALTRALYAKAALDCGAAAFKRDQGNDKLVWNDPNRLLDHGNYLAYGLASVALWVLGIPAAMSIVHGRTRAGGLVFDLADVIKDAFVLGLSFSFAKRAREDVSLDRTAWRAELIGVLKDQHVLQMMFDAIIDGLDTVES